MDNLSLFVGSYAPASAEGIARYTFNEETGQWTRVCGMAGVLNPSFLAVNSAGTMLYAVGEADDAADATLNAVSVADGAMTLAGTVGALGGSPCHVALSPNESQVLVANYGGGSVACYDVDMQGQPQVMDFNVPGAVARAHCSVFTPNGAELWVSDLGRDRIHRFPMRDGRVVLDKEEMKDIEFPAAADPRHVDFHSVLPCAYVIDERDGMVAVLDWRSGDCLQRIQAAEVRGSAHIRVSADGRHVYVSNRLKDDGIAIFAVDAQSGLLSKAGFQPTGVHPRHFALTPNGRYMLVVCRDSHRVEIYRRDADSGMLTAHGQPIPMSAPVCVVLR